MYFGTDKIIAAYYGSILLIGVYFNGELLEMCSKPEGELLENWTFECGAAYWGFDPTYPATITDNGDGSLHLKSNSKFGSLVPILDGAFPSDTYIVECKVRNVVGTGKMSLRKINNSWTNSPDITTDGVHTFEYTGNIKEIHVGANGDSNFEADYDYISLRLKTSNEVITYKSEIVTYKGEEINHG